MAALASDSVIDALRIPHSSALSIEKLACALDMPTQEIATAAGVHRNTLRLNPKSEKAQAFARNIVRVWQAAIDIGNDPETAIFHIKNSPLRPFDYKTTLELVEEGRTDDVVRYFQSLSAGYLG